LIFDSFIRKSIESDPIDSDSDSASLDNIALDDVTAAPDDAFEVALIDANTGLFLLGGTGLTNYCFHHNRQ